MTSSNRTCRKRKISILIALAVTLFAAGSARATILINATETAAGVVFTLSGSFNTASATFAGLAFSNPSNAINPSTGIITFSGGAGLNEWALPNLTGAAPFGSGGSTSTPTGGANFAFAAFFASSDGTALGLLTTYVSGSALTGSMTFAGQSFASLGISPGTYVSSWNNGGIGDSLTFNANASHSIPDTGSTLSLFGLGLAGMIVVARRWYFAPIVRPT